MCSCRWAHRLCGQMTDRCSLWITGGYMPNLLKKTDGLFHLIVTINQPNARISTKPHPSYSYVTWSLLHHRKQLDFTASGHAADRLIPANCTAEICCSSNKNLLFSDAHCLETKKKKKKRCEMWGEKNKMSKLNYDSHFQLVEDWGEVERGRDMEETENTKREIIFIHCFCGLQFVTAVVMSNQVLPSR